MSGRLGEGKWQLAVSADRAIEVVSLLASPTGHLSNLSTTPGGAPSSTGDGNDSIAEAVDVAVGATVSGRIDSVGDVGYFRIDVAHTGTLVVWTSGEVETEQEFLDVHGNPLASAALASTPASSGAMTAKGDFIALNLVWKEIKVRPFGWVIVKVGHKSGMGDFSLGNKHIRVGVTNVNMDNPVPSLTMRAGGSGARVGLAAHFHNPNQLELTCSASVERKLVGGLPINVGVSVSGSEMTIIAPESGPAYSGTLPITVRVSDPFGLLYAELEFPIEFTREEATEHDIQSWGLGCIRVQVTPKNNFSECSSVGADGGTHYGATFTDSCSESVSVKFEWGKFSDDLPRPSSGDHGPIRPEGEGRPYTTNCITGAAPTLRTCAYYADRNYDNHHATVTTLRSSRTIGVVESDASLSGGSCCYGRREDVVDRPV